MILRVLPAEIYLDTSIFVSAIIEDAPHFQACTAFCQNLISANTQVYFSQIVRVELLQALRRLATTRTNLTSAMRAQYRLDDWGSDVQVRRDWLELGITEFEVLVYRLRTAVELPWSLATWRASAQLMVQYGLQARDALHASTAQERGIHALAAVDADYRRVPVLDFWLIRD
ncbi:MAG TPA: type II toxin-antitoxin system VapC family toxin [Chloroflexota bacterium]|jgi:predicted nucleic acid-binding protein